MKPKATPLPWGKVPEYRLLGIALILLFFADDCYLLGSLRESVWYVTMMTNTVRNRSVISYQLSTIRTL